MRILICGDRNYTDWKKIKDYLDTLAAGTIIIHGCAKGADSLAGNLAHGRGWGIIRFPADWDTHGRAAGPIRNQQMLDEGQPDLVVYFHDDIKNSKGTKDMITRAKKNNIPVIGNPIDPKIMEDWDAALIESVGEDALEQIRELRKGASDADII